MNYFMHAVFFCFSWLALTVTHSYAADNIAVDKEEPEQMHTVLQEKFYQNAHPKKNGQRHTTQKMISLYLDNEDMVDLINFLASQKEVNVVLPMLADTINAKVTLHLEEKVTID